MTAVVIVFECFLCAVVGGIIGFLLAACLAVGKYGDSDEQ